MAFTGAAFKAQREEPIGLALRDLAAVLAEDGGDDVPSGHKDFANLVDSIVGVNGGLSDHHSVLSYMVSSIALSRCCCYSVRCTKCIAGLSNPQST